jgi:hypothetical protein
MTQTRTKIFHIEVETAFTCYEEFIVEAEDEQKAKVVAQFRSNPDVLEAEGNEVWTRKLGILDPEEVLEMPKPNDSFYDCEVVDVSGNSHFGRIEEFILQVLERNGESLDEIKLRRKEENNGQINLPI